MRARSLRLLCPLLVPALAACAATTPPKTAASAPPPAAPVTAATAPAPAPASEVEPYPSTYQPLPSQPVLITNATILTAAGDRIERGSVLLRDGKIAAVGATVEAPADAVVIDGTGKWVTPGIIDAHSHLGVYAAPGVDATADGNEATDPEHRRGLGRALGLAAGPAVPAGARRRRDHACRSSPARPTCSAAAA